MSEVSSVWCSGRIDCPQSLVPTGMGQVSTCQTPLVLVLGVVIPCHGVSLTWFFLKYHVLIVGLLPVGLVKDIVS